MNCWVTLNSALTAPCISSNGNISVCTGSGHIIEFIENDQGLPQENILFESDGQPNSVLFEDKNNILICDPSEHALSFISLLTYTMKYTQMSKTNQNNTMLFVQKIQ